jgi:hypothetical protein
VKKPGSLDKRMVCPNPVTVSTAGIRGVFDIQRVIVDMVEPDKLRSRIRNAVSGQYIDGWCTISTGFALTLVAFSCERDMLEQQLDLVDVIKRTFEAPENKNRTTLNTQVTQATSGNKNDTESNAKVSPTSNGFLSQVSPDKTPEQRRVSRMISFVQKPDLHSIAGEWVLARFTGVPGASWFLCRLELGAGHDFYGRRIPTDAFSFEDAAPEQGLTEYWHQFTAQKKARTCDTLEIALYGKKQLTSAHKEVDDLLTKWKSSAVNGEEDLSDLQFVMEIAQNISWDKVANVGKATGMALSGVGSQAWADHLDSRIDKGALKRIPVSLRTPVKDLDRNRKLLPSMFHAGREIHMF